MGRYSNYQYALILSLAGYGLPMLLVSLYLFYNKRNRSVLTIGGSLAGGIDTCQWRYNYYNAPDGEFKILYKIDREIFKKLVKITKKNYKKYMYDRNGATGAGLIQRVRVARKLKYKLADILMFSIYYLNTKDSIQLQTQHFKTPQSVLSRHIIYGLLLLKKTLKHHDESRIAWPSKDEIKSLARLFSRKFPSLDGYNIWAFVVLLYIHFINLFLCLYFCFYVTVTSQFDKSQK